MDQETLTIKKYSLKGEGVAVLEKPIPTPVHIPHTVIGDVVIASLTQKRKKIRKGRVDTILFPSPMRVACRCKHATICGGCCWQQINYSDQLLEKESLIKKAFSSLPGDYPVFPIIGTNDPWNYRNKMEFSFSENRAGTKFLGLMIAKANHYVFNVEECFLGGEWFANFLIEVRTFWETHPHLKAYDYNQGSGLLRAITLREGKYSGQKMVILTISGNESIDQKSIADFTELSENYFQKRKESYSLFLQKVTIEKNKRTQIEKIHLSGSKEIDEQIHLDAKGEKRVLSFSISPDTFFQPNTFQAGVFYSKAIELSQVKEKSIVYDLYCGSGTLGMAFAPFAQKVIAIEINEQAVIDANENLLKNHVTNMDVYCGDVGKTLKQLKEQGKLQEKPDLVIIDPPRAGLDPTAIAQILEILPKKIVYISCNPHTQAENISALISYYDIVCLQPVDQFYHTYHVENLAILQRKE